MTVAWRGAPLVVLALTALLIAACQDGGQQPAAEPKVNAVTSLELFADMVRQVSGDRVEIAALLPSGADPHTFEPTPRDVQKLSEADVVFINGLGLEAALEKTISANVSKDRVVRLSGVPEIAKIIAEEPHWWLDATQAITYVHRIRDALVRVDPAGKSYYKSRAQEYAQELRRLDREVQAAVDTIPASQRKLVTLHKAFNTFADRYGLEVAGFVVASPEGDPSAGDVARLIDAIQDEGIPAVFSEPQLNSKVLEQIADEAGAQVCTLYSDAFDDEVHSYRDMMRFNAQELVRCLGGTSGG
ncbi:MAG: zinc ABC transporter substrate-binding protein [Chloroflexi bacterium]|nr:zinc ABC transporter substrate-binding protein [Chloroflexota bacterium]